MGRALVVGETAEKRWTIVSTLRARHEAHGVGDLGDLEAALDRSRPEVVVLDAGLVRGPRHEPAIQNGDLGEEVLEACRSHGARVLLLCSRADPTSARVLPADDHLVRPFTVADVVARVETLIEGPLTPALAVGDVQIHAGGFRVTRAGHVVALTATERKLLIRLASTPGQVVSKRELMAAVWGYEGYPENLVEVHMSALRRHLEALGPRVIVTERGRGYRLG